MITLRPYKHPDAQAVVKWLRDERSFLFWSAGKFGNFPITAEDMNEYYDRDADNLDVWQMTACDRSGKAIGHFMMRRTGEEKDSIRLGFIVIDSTIRGRGYGKKLIRAALDYSFGLAGAKRVTLGVFENNIPALNCYLSCGFARTGNTEVYELMGEKWIFSELQTTKE